MKIFFISLFILFISLDLFSQVTRYPYVQSTTQHSNIVAWRTSFPVLGSVKYGIDSSNLIFTVYDDAPTFNHGILLENLQENTKYYYAIYSGFTLETSEFFYTAKDSTNNDFSFMHYGDCGYNSVIQNQVGDLMEADSAEFAVVCGDIDQGGVPHFSPSGGGDNYDEIFFDVYNDGDTSKMLSRECHFTAIGNHDYYANNGASYDNAFYLPHNNSENSERYYSFSWGDAKFICLDVITPYDPSSIPPYNDASFADSWWTDFRVGSPQYQFLENELQCNDKKWVFVYFHEGPWTNYWGSDYYVHPTLGGDYYYYDGNIMVRDELVPLFEQYNVDFVLNGHSHLYERGEKNGVTYVTSGSAGDHDPSANVLYANHPELQVAVLDNVYARFTVNDDSVYLECVNKDNSIVDTYSKSKSYVDYDVSMNITDASCYLGADGSVTINVVGPKGPYTLEWFDNASTDMIRTNLSMGTYYAYIRNTHGCEKVISVFIDEAPMLIPQIVSQTGVDLFCEGDTISLSTVNSYASYNWSIVGTDSILKLTTEETVSIDVVTNEGCIGVSVPFSVSYISNPLADFNYAFSDLSYNFLATNDVNTDIYTWNFGDGSNDTSIADNLINHVFLENGNYNVSLYASNECVVDTFVINIQIGDAIDSIPDNLIGIKNITSFKVFPNPMNESSTVLAENFEGVLKVSIYNVTGKLVRSFKSRQNNFTLKKKALIKVLTI